METSHQHHNEGDIVREKYAGPSARVAAAGQGFIEHFLYAISGLIGAGALAFIFHKPAAKIVTSARELGTRLKSWSPEGTGVINRGKDTITNWMGGALHVAFGDTEVAQSIQGLIREGHPQAERLANLAHDKRQGFGNALLSHTIGILPWVGSRFKEVLRNANERWSMAIAFGGAAGVVGYITGWAKALFQGAKHGNAGKRQFERAQSEIKDLRERNDDLEKINGKLHAEVVAEKTRWKDTEANREEGDRAAEPAKKETAAGEEEKAPAIRKLRAAEHRGMLADERAATPEMV